MLCKSPAIVLKTINYSETSLVVKAYTLHYGLKSFLVRSVRKKKAKNSPNLFQPLSLLEIVFINKETSALIIPKEISSYQHFSTIPFDVHKSSVILFINELIYRSVHEEEANPPLFHFLLNTILFIDTTPHSVSNIHLVFSVQLTRFLGFFPFGNFSPGQPWFLLHEGLFSKYAPAGELALTQEESHLFDTLIRVNLETSHQVEMSNPDRNRMLQIIILYYQLHLIGFGDIKSLQVLNQLFHS